jgi:hypothetical protein
VKPERVGEPGVDERLARSPLLNVESGPFSNESQHEPLTEAEEAALAFAACGVTGYALAGPSYGRGQGGGMLAGLLGPAVASPDAIDTVNGGPDRRDA